ncbi:thiol:disulfide interchange protein DsbA/DsbL [Pseudoalteromonas sp. T1lg65]|uniref:thiol:disulfide interchange protein DsbA/DsbL n=1 Tax=Pseudoalteromonas sp. T1lg65 TaxID=2077101 RepID=UPI003F79E1E9
MLKVIKGLALAFILPVFAQAAQFEEGVHYDVIAERGTKSPQVTEYFSFFCPACNAMEGLLVELKPKLDKEVKFKQSHVDFIGSRKPEVQSALATGLAIAEVLPEKDKLVAAVFNHIHGKRASVNELADIKDIFVAQGVDGAKFDKLAQSFAVRTKTSKMQRMQKTMSEKGALTGVPTFIVNGKYKLNLRESGTTKPEQIAALINYLAKK